MGSRHDGGAEGLLGAAAAKRPRDPLGAFDSDPAPVAKRSASGPQAAAGPAAAGHGAKAAGAPPVQARLRIVNPDCLDRAAALHDENVALARQVSLEFANGELDRDADDFAVPRASPRASPRPGPGGGPMSSPRPFACVPAQGLPAEANGDAGSPAGAGPSPADKLAKTTPAHTAVLAGDLAALGASLKGISRDDLDACDARGYSSLMCAAAAQPPEAALSLVNALIAAGADVLTCDNEGFTALHWAAAMGNAPVLVRLTQAGANVAASSANGDTALHRAARFGHTSCISELVTRCGAPTSARNSLGQSAVDVAGQCGANRLQVAKLREQVRKAFFDIDHRLKTLVLFHEECLEHRTAQAHQEAPERCVAIRGKLKAELDECFIHSSNNFPPAIRQQLLYAHNERYIDFVFDLHNKVAKLGGPVPFTPRVQVMHGVEKARVKAETGCDTFFSQGSLPAALRAVGAVCNAVDRVVSGHNRNAFCIVRPPGHHAGVSGLLQDAISCGFCIFNNVAIAAMHALRTYPTKVKRVAIVDFDVHHGNGTEEIIRTKFNNPSAFFFFSVHLFDKPPTGGEFYPGSGGSDDATCNIVNAPLTPLWRVAANKTRSRSRTARNGGADGANGAHAGRIATRGSSRPQVATDVEGSDNGDSGGEPSRAPPRDNGEDAAGRASSTTANQDSVAGSGATPTYGRAAFRANITDRLLPALHEFKPDLIFISAGFDAGKNDIGCSKTENGKYSSGIDLLPEDYNWATKQIQAAADVCCHGRVVSALEGGYGTWARVKDAKSGSGNARKLVLNRDQLAENALAHVKALVN